MPHGVVLEEARNVAQELGLPPWWLNEQASVYISGKDDPSKRRVFDHPGLRVTAASPRHIFAMKALAARTRDIDDLRLLVLQRHFVIMRVRGLVGGSGRLGRWPDVGVAIVTSAAAWRARPAAGTVR